MITAKSKEGINRNLIYNDIILLISEDDLLSIKVEEIDLELNFTFSKEGEKYKTTGTSSNNKKKFDIILHIWDEPLGIQTTKPFQINKDDRSYEVRWRTAATIKSNFRDFHISIWEDLK